MYIAQLKALIGKYQKATIKRLKEMDVSLCFKGETELCDLAIWVL